MQIDIKAKLLQYTYAELFINGYQAANTTRILQNAKINKGSMYHYFRNKKALVLAVLESILKEKIIAHYSVENEEYSKEKLLKLLKSTDLIVQKHGSMLSNLSAEMSGLDEEFRVKLNEINDIRVQSIKKHLESFRDGDQSNMCNFILSLIDGATISYKRTQNIKFFYNNIKIIEDYL